MIEVFCSVENGNGIGFGNQRPWHFQQEIQRLYAVSEGKRIVMGRRAFASYRDRFIANRQCLVVSSKLPDVHDQNTSSRTNVGVQEVLDLSLTSDSVVIGGAQTIDTFLLYADKVTLLRIARDYDCCTVFLPPLAGWVKTQSVRIPCHHDTLLEETWLRA